MVQKKCQSIEPDKDYILPLGKARIVIENTEKIIQYASLPMEWGFIGHKVLLLNIMEKSK